MGQALCLELRTEDDGAAGALGALPTEIVLRILHFLTPREVCTIALLNSQWRRVADLDVIWRRLCVLRVPGLDLEAAARLQLLWKQVFIMVQSFVFCFNMSGEQGLNMFFEVNLLRNDPVSVAVFLNSARNLNKTQIGRIVTNPTRQDVALAFVCLQPVRNVFLGEALRDFLAKFTLPITMSMSRLAIVEKFAEHYWQANRDRLSFSQDTAVLLVFSLMMLTTDLNSPHIKNKMTKREFIRNLRHSNARELSTDYLGLLYDFVFLQGLAQRPAAGGNYAQRVCHTVISQMSHNRVRPWETTQRLLTLR